MGMAVGVGVVARLALLLLLLQVLVYQQRSDGRQKLQLYRRRVSLVMVRTMV
jgi:hypothetical protein